LFSSKEPFRKVVESEESDVIRCVVPGSEGGTACGRKSIAVRRTAKVCAIRAIRLIGWGIKFRPIKPRSPHLNGKVERTQRADLEEFWPTVDPKSPDVQQRLDEWQHFWNWRRPHTGLGGRSPIDRVCERLPITPSADAVEAAYDPSKERLRIANFTVDTTLAWVK
jgi:hypothetical protein